MKYGVLLNRLSHSAFADITLESEGLGFESVWLGEHVVMPMRQDGEIPSTYPPLPPTLPILDSMMVLTELAVRTDRIRLGSFVYLLNARHPFLGARAAMTLDRISNGRLIFGVGAGWLRNEFSAMGIDPATRGARLDEAVAVCRRLWSEEQVEHAGKFYEFEAVAFEPKPLAPGIQVHFGGESERAFRRVGETGEGWLGVHHDPASAKAAIQSIRRAADAAGRDPDAIEMSIVSDPESVKQVAELEAVGVDRVIVSPWTRTSEATNGLRRFAQSFMA